MDALGAAPGMTFGDGSAMPMPPAKRFRPADFRVLMAKNATVVSCYHPILVAQAHRTLNLAPTLISNTLNLAPTVLATL